MEKSKLKTSKKCLDFRGALQQHSAVRADPSIAAGVMCLEWEKGPRGRENGSKDRGNR